MPALVVPVCWTTPRATLSALLLSLWMIAIDANRCHCRVDIGRARPPPMQATGSDGQFERTRVTSTLAPLPVRQHALVPGVATGGGRAIYADAAWYVWYGRITN